MALSTTKRRTNRILRPASIIDANPRRNPSATIGDNASRSNAKTPSTDGNLDYGNAHCCFFLRLRLARGFAVFSNARGLTLGLGASIPMPSKKSRALSVRTRVSTEEPCPPSRFRCDFPANAGLFSRRALIKIPLKAQLAETLPQLCLEFSSSLKSIEIFTGKDRLLL